jgi:hypothetical protein
LGLAGVAELAYILLLFGCPSPLSIIGMLHLLSIRHRDATHMSPCGGVNDSYNVIGMKSKTLEMTDDSRMPYNERRFK